MRATFAGLILASLGGMAAAQDAGLVTGPAGGTAGVIGGELAAQGALCGVGIAPVASLGSIENAEAVRDRPGIQLGLVQEDVLEYIRTLAPGDAGLRRMAQGLRVVMPLHLETIHLVARDGIATLADLGGRRVATGPEASGTALTAGLVLDLTGTEPAERVALGPEPALAALAAGEVDAAFIVGGAPVPALAAFAAEGFHLVPLTDPVLTAVYAPVRVPGGTYPLGDAGVEALAVRSVLTTFDFSATGNAYHRASCAAVGDVAQLVVTRLDQLRAGGHPAWGTVDPADLPAGWEISACALAGLAPGRALVCEDDAAAAPEAAARPEVPPAGQALFLQRVCGRVDC